MNYLVKNCNNYNSYFYEKCYHLLNSYQKSKINKLKNKKDKQMSILGMYLIAQLLNIPINTILYKKRKPYVKNEFYISISHKDPYVAVAVSNMKIGIDIEIIKKIDKNTLFYLQEQNSKEALLSWTKKESLFKSGLKKNYKYKTIIINKSIILTICEKINLYKKLYLKRIL